MPYITFEKPGCKCCPLSPHGYHLGKDATVTIMPGGTVLSKAEYDAIKTDSIFIHRVKTEGYKVDEKMPGDIKKLPVNTAVEVVGETGDVRVLRTWMVGEQREEVRRAIDAQLTALQPPAETKPAEAKK